ncbi:MAG: phenylacetate--CoA ligase, partial [Bacteroidota bacterium]|nr:phenylacetate--CoA ligase [Bacteroidota bacterium]
MYLHETLETLSRDGIEKLQMERLRKTLNHCLNSPFYRKRFAEHKLRPEDIKTLDDLRKIPFTTKNDLRE